MSKQEMIALAIKGYPLFHIGDAKGKDMTMELIKIFLTLALFVFDDTNIFLRISEQFFLPATQDEAVRIIYSMMNGDTRLVIRPSQVVDCLERMRNFPEFHASQRKMFKMQGIYQPRQWCI